MVWRHFKLNDVKGEEASGNGGLYHPSLAPPRIMNGNGPPCSSLNAVREQGGPGDMILETLLAHGSLKLKYFLGSHMTMYRVFE